MLNHRAAALILILALGGCAATPPQRALLSIRAEDLAQDRKVSGFQIITHGLTALEVCRRPPNWVISYGNSSDNWGGGMLGASAKTSDDYLEPVEFPELNRLYLVVRDGRPFALEGYLTIRDLKTGEATIVALPDSSILLEPGESCD